MVQTKSMKVSPSKMSTPKFHDDDAKWMRKVVNQENAKPLEVSRDFVLDYERKEKDNADKLATQVERHIHTLRSLRGKLEDRVDLKSRTDDYRSWHREFKDKKEAVAVGRTIDEYNRMKDSTAPATTASGVSKKVAPKSDLSHVLDSLTRLSELEGRISKLETGNVYDNLLEAEDNPKIPQNPREIDFKKKRTLGGDKSSMKVMYAVQPGRKGQNNALTRGAAPGRTNA